MSSKYFHKALPPNNTPDAIHILGKMGHIVTSIEAFDDSGELLGSQRYRLFKDPNEAITYERQLPPHYKGRTCTPAIHYNDGSVLLLQQESRFIPAQETPFEHIKIPQLWTLTDLRRAFLQTYNQGLTEQRQCFTFCLAMLHNLTTTSLTYAPKQFIHLTEPKHGFNYLFHLATYLYQNTNAHLYTLMCEKLVPKKLTKLINQGYALLLPIEKHTWLEHVQQNTENKRHAIIILRDTDSNIRLIDQSGVHKISNRTLNELCTPTTEDSTFIPWYDHCLIIGIRKKRHMLSNQELASIIKQAKTEIIINPRTENYVKPKNRTDYELDESKPSIDINIYETNFQLVIEHFMKNWLDTTAPDHYLRIQPNNEFRHLDTMQKQDQLYLELAFPNKNTTQIDSAYAVPGIDDLKKKTIKTYKRRKNNASTYTPIRRWN